MTWLDKIRPNLTRRGEESRRNSVPKGLWKKCQKCEAVLYRPELDRNLDVCPKCGHHMRISSRRRLDSFLDELDQQEICQEVEPIDRLKFRDLKRYRDRIITAQKATGEKDALVTMRGTVFGMPVICAAFEFNFHGGSMGYAVGEKFTRAASIALADRVPMVCFQQAEARACRRR